jgi:hypothetical protein
MQQRHHVLADVKVTTLQRQAGVVGREKRMGLVDNSPVFVYFVCLLSFYILSSRSVQSLYILSSIRLLPIEVAATWDLTPYRPDKTLPGSAEKLRPYGGLNTTQEVKESRYFILMLALAAYGYDLVGVPAPSPPHQPSRTFPTAPSSRRIYYPYWIPDQAGRRYDIPKIHTIILGVLGAIPASAVRSAEAAGATADSALWHDLTVLLAAGLHGSFSIPAQARRAASSSAPQPQPQGGVG